jgi:hypothetical protein
VIHWRFASQSVVVSRGAVVIDSLPPVPTDRRSSFRPTPAAVKRIPKQTFSPFSGAVSTEKPILLFSKQKMKSVQREVENLFAVCFVCWSIWLNFVRNR